jgi:hypothetical protein
MNRLGVHIERLTLEGKSGAEGRRIVAAIERHLAALANGAAVPDAEHGPAPHSASADALGHRIAAQVFRMIAGPRHA